MRKTTFTLFFWLFFLEMAFANSQNFRDIPGFKFIHFGMSQERVESFGGFQCQPNPLSAGTYCTATNTIFGMRAAVFVLLRNDMVSSIHVTAYDNKPVDLIRHLSNVFGPPNLFESPSIGGSPLSIAYWISRRQTSIYVTTRADGQINPPDSRSGQLRYSQTVVFQDETGTAELLRRENVARNPGRDF